MTHAERQRRYRERHPDYVAVDNNRRASRRPVYGQARNPDRLMSTEKRALRSAGEDPSHFRVETGRPYTLYGGSEGPELYCSDGYLQGEPCPHSCWSN